MNKIVADDGTIKVVGTLVEPSSVVIDEPKLRKRLGAAMWNKITTRVLDKNKLDAFIKSGEIKTSDLAACSDEVDRKPYVKVTVK